MEVSINNILNLIIKKDLNSTETSILQDALNLSLANAEFSLNTRNIQAKNNDKKLTKQAILTAIKKLENKGILKRLSAPNETLKHSLVKGVFNA